MGITVESVFADLAQRLAALPTDARAVHHTILRTFADTGTAPSRATLDDHASLAILARNDLIGLDGPDADSEIAFAYPFSVRPTAHQVRLPEGAQPYAMCAIDALGVPAMLATDAVITSHDIRTYEPSPLPSPTTAPPRTGIPSARWSQRVTEPIAVPPPPPPAAHTSTSSTDAVPPRRG